MSAKNKFGDALRASRVAAGISLREAARRSGISPTFLSRLESGRETSCADDTLQRLADACSASSDELHVARGTIPPDVRELLRGNRALWVLIRHPK